MELELLSSLTRPWVCQFKAKESSGFGFACIANAAPSFSCVPTAIAASAIAACIVASKRGSDSDAAPTAAINRVWKHEMITAIGSSTIGSAAGKRA